MHPPLSHFASPDYWPLYHRLPSRVRRTADKYFNLLKSDPRHHSLHLKKIGDLWSVRAGIHYRAVGMDTPNEGERNSLVLDRVTCRIRPLHQEEMREPLPATYFLKAALSEKR
jgi:hypothetical protein